MGTRLTLQGASIRSLFLALRRARCPDSVWLGYLMAVVSTGIAAWLRWGFDRLLGEGYLHSMSFYPAVIISALIGGTGAGVLATLLSAATLEFFFIQPVGSFNIHRRGDMAALIVFVLTNLTISTIGGAFRAAQRQSERQARELGEHVQQLTLAAERQRQYEEKLRLQSAAMESAADAIVVTDRQGTIQWANEAFARLTGYSVREAIGQNPRILKSEKMSPAFYQDLWRTLQEGRIWHGEFVNKRKDGQFFVEETTIAPVRERGGQIVNFVAIKTDITRRKEAEQRLKTQLEQMKLLEEITLAIGRHQDIKSIFQVVVQRLEDQLRIDFACVFTYDPSASALAVASVGGRSETLAAALALNEGARIERIEGGLSRCADGQLVYEPDVPWAGSAFSQRLAGQGLHSVVLAPLQVESQVLGILLAARKEIKAFSASECDFFKLLSGHVALASYQAQLHNALQQAFDDLRKSQERVMQQERLHALGQMASGVAHDINNALAPASLYIQTLLEETAHPHDERSREYLQTIHRSIDDVANTVARMREFSRQREPQMALAPVQINLLLQQVIALSRPRWRDLSQRQGALIKLETNLAPDLPVVMGAESEIREALVNLVFNAADAMPNGGLLTLCSTLAPDKTGLSSVIIEITDTGVGMDEETRRRCVEPFFTTKGERGTGLGLAMVYGTVRRHGGAIEIDSEPGRGTTMRLFFPAVTGTPPSQQTLRTPSVPQGLRVLLIDDEPLVLEALRSVLEFDGHVITEARDGQKGIEAFRAAHGGTGAFDVVLTDLGMPSTDGRQVAKAIKELSPTTPVILLTGWGQQLADEGSIPPHVDHLLSKPPRLIELRGALARWCRQAEPPTPATERP
jgi:PAS domain S-box-containing protein